MGKTVANASDNRPRTAGLRARFRVLEPGHDAEVAVQQSRVSRAMNFTIALVGLLLTAPIMLVIGLLIKLTSRGPVFYRQARIGLDARTSGALPNDPRRRMDLGGRPFTILKFRTMTVDAERHTGAVWATQEDPRVTAVGRVLRKYRLDELPQLVNVLRGEMNIVGPRPERPTIFADLREKIPDYQRRQRAKPGITGLAQINQQYDSTIDDVRNKLRYDLMYIERQGLLEDLKIMLKTVPVILFRRGGW